MRRSRRAVRSAETCLAASLALVGVLSLAGVFATRADQLDDLRGADDQLPRVDVAAGGAALRRSE